MMFGDIGRLLTPLTLRNLQALFSANKTQHQLQLQQRKPSPPSADWRGIV